MDIEFVSEGRLVNSEFYVRVLDKAIEADFDGKAVISRKRQLMLFGLQHAYLFCQKSERFFSRINSVVKSLPPQTIYREANEILLPEEKLSSKGKKTCRRRGLLKECKLQIKCNRLEAFDDPFYADFRLTCNVWYSQFRPTSL
jgi:hypothetical protein